MIFYYKLDQDSIENLDKCAVQTMKNIEKELKRVGVNEIAVNTYKGTPDDYVKLPEDAVFLAEAGFIDQASLADFTADDFKKVFPVLKLFKLAIEDDLNNDSVGEYEMLSYVKDPNKK